MPNRESVNYSHGEYVRDNGVSTDSVESSWSMLKRGYHSTIHHLSEKHTDGYVAEFAGRLVARTVEFDGHISAIGDRTRPT